MDAAVSGNNDSRQNWLIGAHERVRAKCRRGEGTLRQRRRGSRERDSQAELLCGVNYSSASV